MNTEEQKQATTPTTQQDPVKPPLSTKEKNKAKKAMKKEARKKAKNARKKARRRARKAAQQAEAENATKRALEEEATRRGGRAARTVGVGSAAAASRSTEYLSEAPRSGTYVDTTASSAPATHSPPSSPTPWDVTVPHRAVIFSASHSRSASPSPSSSSAADISQAPSSAAYLSPEDYKNPGIARPSLPILPYLDSIVRIASRHSASCVLADTGSGKSCCIPTALAETGLRSRTEHSQIIPIYLLWFLFAATPTVASVRSLARFVKQQYPHISVGHACGGEVFYNASNDVVFATAGHVYRMLFRDKDLKGFDVLVEDEAHNVSTDYDLLELAIMYIRKHGQLHEMKWGADSLLTAPPSSSSSSPSSSMSRASWHLVISSATLDPANIRAKWGQGVVITEVAAPSYPVKVVHHPTTVDVFGASLLKEITKVIVQRNNTEPAGHFLVFLPGARAIEDLMLRLYNHQKALANTEIFPAYSQLPAEEIELALNQSPPQDSKDMQRSIILATDVFETSVTIPGVVLVIDSGRKKLLKMLPHDDTGTMLVEEWTSVFSLTQRKVRYGLCVIGGKHEGATLLYGWGH